MVVVFGIDTRVLVRSDGATKADALEAQATAITADFICHKGSRIRGLSLR